MLNARLNAARQIAEALIPSETDIEQAISSTSRLIGVIADARGRTKVPFAMGQDSLTALGTTLGSLIQARSAIVAAHAALAQDRTEAGLDAFGMGDVSECPPKTASLSVVEDQRSVA